jgi:signal transduction histidine kinase
VFRSVTGRLTAWYTLILALILSCTGAISLLGMEWFLKGEARKEIRAQVDLLRQNLRLAPGQDLAEKARNLEGLAEREGLMLALVDSGGRTLARLPRGEEEPLPEVAPDQEKVLVWNGRPVVAAAVEVPDPGAGAARLVVAQSLRRDWATLGFLARLMALAGVAGLVLAFAGGRAMAQAAMRPVAAITQAARKIGAEDLSQRLTLSWPRDELYELGATFNDMLDRLEEAFRRQKDFVAHASHELRTPVAVIEGHARMLARWGRGDPAVLDESLRAIIKETQGMKRLIADLLSLARLDEERGVKKEEVFLPEVVEEVWRDAALVAGDVEVRRGELAPARVWGDYKLLRQALMILVDNAIKYNRPGGTVTIDVSADARWARLNVADTGIGIPPEDLGFIFDRFYRARHQGEGARAEGSGLGLAIAKRVAEVHGGRIAVSSRPGQGSIFTIQLPLMKEGERSGKVVV